MSRKRLNLDFPLESFELLQKISDESGKSMSEVLRTALALYGIAKDEQSNGRELGVIQGDKVIKEILIPK